MTHAQLRVAISTDGPAARWQVRCAEALAAIPGVTLERWVQLSANRPRRRAGKEAGRFRTVPFPDALKVIEPEAYSISAPPDSGRVALVDVLLDLTSTGVELPVPWASEVWRFGYGRSLSRDPALAALITYAAGRGVTRVALISEPAGAIVREGWLLTAAWWDGDPVERLLLDTADWPALVALQRLDPTLEATVPSHSRSDESTRLFVGRADRVGRSTGLSQSLLEVAALGRRMRGWVDVLSRHPDWNIGIVQAPIEQMLAPDEDQAVAWLPARPGHFAADPFGLERDGTLHIFFEDFDRRSSKGTINHVAIDPHGTVSEPECVLDPGVHASYPFLVVHDGADFMLPETAASGNLVLYEALDFPRRWRPAVTMLSGIPAVDPSVIEYAGRWWMFATRLDRGHNHNLFVWHARHLTGPWTPHAANPVKTDARSARSGGTPFIVEGKLTGRARTARVHTAAASS